jgi:hypothetical protein
MPLKLCVGLSRNLGDRNFNSRGASVNFELELDTGVLQHEERIQEYIRKLCHLARASLSDELLAVSGGTLRPATEGVVADAPAGLDLGPDSVGLANPMVRPATEGQVKAIYSLAKRKQLDLANLMRSRFSVDSVEDLSLPAASALIDELKHDAAA